MPPKMIRPIALSLCIVSLSLTACTRGATGSTFLSLIGIEQRPIVVALIAQPGILDPFTPNEKLREALSADIKRPVRFDLCLPVQLTPNLLLGFYDLAIVPPSYYAELSNPERFPIVAATVDASGKVAHSAVLVVPASSTVQNIEELKGQRIGFGPATDARTHHAGLTLLKEHGLEKTDTSLSLLPVPGSLRHYPTMRDVALATQNGSIEAGFIDEEAFDQFAEHSDAEDEPARDRLRVIGRTKPVPDLLVIRSPKANPEMVERVSEFLLAAGKNHPDALRPLLVTAYEKPSAELCAWSDKISNAETSKPAEPNAEPNAEPKQE